MKLNPIIWASILIGVSLAAFLSIMWMTFGHMAVITFFGIALTLGGLSFGLAILASHYFFK